MSILINAFIANFSVIQFIRDDFYLDPGSGSFLVQLIIASLLGATFVIRASWSKIKRFFNRTPEISEDELENINENEE